jgi:molybdenum cofactor cytidylyltransferase
MIAGIILAAGESKRFPSQNKLLYELSSGKNVIESIILAFLNSNIDAIYIVTGYDSETIERTVTSLILESDKKVTFVYNENYKSGGMSSSVIKGLVAAEKANAVLITPADIPLIPPEIINMMISKFLVDTPDIIIPTFKKRKGHPILFNSLLFPEILKISENHRGLKQITSKYKEKILFLPTQDAGILRDLDTPEDLNKF